MGATVTWERGAETGGPKEGCDLAGWRNGRKTSVSKESERGQEGAGLRAVDNGRLWDGSHQMVQSRGGMSSDVGVKRVL